MPRLASEDASDPALDPTLASDVRTSLPSPTRGLAPAPRGGAAVGPWERRHARRGFTAVELVLMLVLAAAVAAIVIFHVQSVRAEAARATMLSDLRTFTVDEEGRRQRGLVSDTSRVTLSDKDRIELRVGNRDGYALVLRHPSTHDRCWVTVAATTDPTPRCGVPLPLPTTLTQVAAVTRVDRLIDTLGRVTTRVTTTVADTAWRPGWLPGAGGTTGGADTARAIALAWTDSTATVARDTSRGTTTITRVFDGDRPDSAVVPTPLALGGSGGLYGGAGSVPGVPGAAGGGLPGGVVTPTPGFGVGGLTGPVIPPRCVAATTTLSADTLTVDGRRPVTGSWNLGDGRTLAGLTVVASWPSAGTYPVTLTMRDSTGAGRLVRRAVVVSTCGTGTVAPDTTTPTGTPPTARLAVSRSWVAPGETLRLDGSLSSGATGLVNYRFAPGALPPVGGTRPTADVRFPSEGVVRVTLTVTDSAGRTGTAERFVTVSTVRPPVDSTAGTVTVSPASVAVGRAATATVTLVDVNGQPASGVTVDLVLSGPSARAAGAPVTDAAGRSVSTLTGTAVGAVTVRALGNGRPSAGTATLSVTAPPPPVAGSLAFVAGDAQAGLGRSRLATDPAVLVRDTDGQPMPGVTVLFTPATGGGRVLPGAGDTTLAAGTLTATTNAQGTAAVGWILGPTLGAQTLRASTSGLVPAVATATAGVGPSAAVLVVRGDAQAGVVGRDLADAPVVRVIDAAWNPVAGARVTFTVTQGAGMLGGGSAPVTQTTDADGLAAAPVWTLGSGAGRQTLVAGTPGATPATLGATALPGTATALALVTAPSASAASGTPLGVSPVVAAVDAYGNPVPAAGQSVQVAAARASGTAPAPTLTPGTSATTDSLGRAAFPGLTLSGLGGPVTLQFTSAGLAGVTSQTITLGAGVPAVVTAVSPTAFQGLRGAPVGAATLPRVRVVDAAGNPVPNAPVAFGLTAGGGTVTGATPSTDAAGLAGLGAWTLDAAGSVSTVGAVVSGASGPLPTVSFTATSRRAAAVRQLGLVSGRGAAGTSVVGDALPGVVVLDENGLPLPGVDVLFAAPSGGGAATGLVGTTDAAGTVRVGSWSLGATGSQAITATVSSVGASVYSWTLSPRTPTT